MDRTRRRLDFDMDEDGEDTRDDAAFEHEQRLRSLYPERWFEQRRQRRIVEQRQEPYQLLPSARSQPATGSLEASEQWMRANEEHQQRRAVYIEPRPRWQRQSIQRRLEPARPQLGSLEGNERVKSMMAAMGYVPGMSLGKNRHWIVPPAPPSSQNGFIRVGTDPDFEEAIEFDAARAMRDLSLVDEP